MLYVMTASRQGDTGEDDRGSAAAHVAYEKAVLPV
jgi:hypothetical protein